MGVKTFLNTPPNQFLPPTDKVEKVMFSVVSVCLYCWSVGIRLKCLLVFNISIHPFIMGRLLVLRQQYSYEGKNFN